MLLLVAFLLIAIVRPFLNGIALSAHKHALALDHASRGGKCKGRRSLPVERSDNRVEGRSAKEVGTSTARKIVCLLRGPGTKPLRRSGFLVLRGAQKMRLL